MGLHFLTFLSILLYINSVPSMCEKKMKARTSTGGGRRGDPCGHAPVTTACPEEDLLRVKLVSKSDALKKEKEKVSSL